MITRMLRGMLWVALAIGVFGYSFLALRRIGAAEPFHPIEEAVLSQAAHIAQGAPLEAVTTAAPAPALLPGFPFAVSVLARAFGPAYWEPRLLSLLAALAAAGLLLAIVAVETGSWSLGAASAACMLLGCGLLTGPPEVARPEYLFWVLALAGFAALRAIPGLWGDLLAALLVAAAIFTQHLGVGLAIGALVYLALENVGRLVVFAFGLLVACLVGGLWLSAALGPELTTQAWSLPLQSLRFDPPRLLVYVGDHLLGKLGVLTLAAVLSFALPNRPWRGLGGNWMCMGLGVLAAGLITTQTSAAGPHSLIPSVVALALLGPISIQRVTRHLAAWPGSSRLGGQGVVISAMVLQLVMFAACPTPVLPPKGGAQETAATQAPPG